MIQAIGLAFAGSFYPVGLLFVLRFLAAKLRLATLFLIGGSIGCLAVAILELVLLSNLPLNPRRNPAPNGAVNIVLGVLLLGLAVFFLLRKPTKVEEEVVSTVQAAGESEPKREPSSGRAFLTGLIVYSPGLGLIAAVKALHDANYSVGLLTVGVIICTVIVLWMAEVPIIATAISPVRSGPLLRKGGDFIARNTRLISWLIAAAIGAYLIIDGISVVVSN